MMTVHDQALLDWAKLWVYDSPMQITNMLDALTDSGWYPVRIGSVPFWMTKTGYDEFGDQSYRMFDGKP